MYPENLTAMQQEEMPDNSSLKTAKLKLTNSNSVHSQIWATYFGFLKLLSIFAFKSTYPAVLTPSSASSGID